MTKENNNESYELSFGGKIFGGLVLFILGIFLVIGAGNVFSNTVAYFSKQPKQDYLFGCINEIGTSQYLDFNFEECTGANMLARVEYTIVPNPYKK